MSLFAGMSLILAFGRMVTLGGVDNLIDCVLWRVDCMPAGVSFMWPFAVAVDSGRYF